MEDERIIIIHNWFEPYSVKDIQIFRTFANFYWQFFHGFDHIAISLTIILGMTSKRREDNFVVVNVRKTDSGAGCSNEVNGGKSA